MKALITGSAGFIGSALSKRLTQLGHEVVGIDDLRTGEKSRVNNDETWIDEDIGELMRSDWLELVGQSDIVFHLAAEKYNSSKATPERVIQVNVAASERLISACALLKKPVIFTSSLYVYGPGDSAPQAFLESDLPNPHTIYGASKLMGENLLEAYHWSSGLQYSALRLFFIFGPNQFAEGGYKSVIIKNLEQLRDGNPLTVVGTGTQELDYVHVDDCIDVMIALMSKPLNGVANLSSGYGQSILGILNLLARLHDIPFEPLFLEKDWTEGTKRVGDNTRICSHLNWNIKVPFELGITNLYNIYLNGERNDSW